MGWEGLEPSTNALKGRCSTIELPTRLFTGSVELIQFPAGCKAESQFFTEPPERMIIASRR